MGSRRIGIWALLAGALVLVLGVGMLRKGNPTAARLPCTTAVTPPADTIWLRPEETLERRITEAATDTYGVHLDVGQVLRAVVYQKDVDVVVQVLDPCGELVLAVDGPNGPDGPEPVAIIARFAGLHWLTVTAPRRASGSYKLQVESLGVASDQDRFLAQGMEEYSAAEELRSVGDAHALAEALEKYQNAYRLLHQADAPLLSGRALRRTGQVLYRLGEVGAAIERLQSALEQYADRANGWELAPLLNDVGTAYRQVGEPTEAGICFERSVQISEEVGNGYARAVALNNLGVLNQSTGEFQTALDFYDRALDAWRDLGQPSNRANTLHNVGITLTALGYLEEARSYLDEALSLRQGDPRGLAATLMAAGWLQELTGDVLTATKMYDDALTLLQLVGDRQGEAVAFDLRGTAYLKLGQPEQALDSYQKALAIADEKGSTLNKANTLTNLGRFMEGQDRFEEARVYVRLALDLFRRLDLPNGEASALAASARIERRCGNLEIARTQLEQALTIVESVRGRLQSGAFRSGYLAVHHSAYESYVDVLMQLDAQQPGRGFAARAFVASERAHARSLLESLGEAVAGVRGQAASEVLASERRLRAKIHAKETARIHLLDEGATAKALYLEEQLGSLLFEYEKLQGDLRDGARLSEPHPLDLRRIQSEVLDEGTLLLAYALGEERSYLWLVSPASVESFPLPPRSDIESLVRQVVLTVPGNRQDLRQQSVLALRALSEMVLAPAAARLGEKRLAIIADGALQSVPFAALPIHDHRAEGGRGEWRPLIAEHEVVRLPSASVLALLRAETVNRAAPPGMLAVVADPVFQPDDPRLRTAVAEKSPLRADQTSPRDLEHSIHDLGLNSLERLPYSGAEAEAILALAPRDQRFSALGLEANREMVLAGTLSRYRFVHFATHGLINERYPPLSGIVLSLFDGTGRARDGFLRLHEIFDLSLPVDLVVLSACRTALGKEVRGEGLVGLAYGFHYAGVPRVVVSLWNVDDQATAALMTHFYQGMIERHLRPAQALREAQLSMLEDDRWNAPYYWAGFFLQGEWR